MIRPAVISDLTRMERMGERFFEASGLGRWFTFKPRCFSKLMADMMAGNQAVVLVGEGPEGVVSMAAMVSYSCWFDDEHLTAQELFWWVEPFFRGGTMGARLHQGLEDWARKKGCVTMEMGALEELKPDSLEALYQRMGYGPKERIF